MNGLRSRTTRLLLCAAGLAAATAFPLAAARQAAPAGTVSPSLYRTVYYRPLTRVQPRRARHGGHGRAVEAGASSTWAPPAAACGARPIPARAGSRSPTARSASARSARSRSSLSNPDVIYVGTGSADPRGNVTNGDGVYKSTDAGKTWTHVGLEKAGLIGRIRVHPQNPDIAYVAALGNIFGPNPERGVYRTKDGGKTWEQVLKVSDQTGAQRRHDGRRRTRTRSSPRCGPRSARRGRSTRAARAWKAGLFRSTDGGTHLAEADEGAAAGERDGRQVERVDLAGGSEARLRADRSRRRPGRRLSLGGRRRHLGAGERARAPCCSAPSTTSTSTPIRSRPTPSTRSTPAR